MITSQTSYEKDQLIRSIFKTQKEIASLLLEHPDKKRISHLIYEWHSHRNFFINNAAITNFSLNDLKERYNQVINLLEKA
ncbi:hypothetical protein BCAH820_4363 [Bacillus cereus AH820]|uniref:Uncharacterized protein n=1 Tax=Bacillus cereus (strain AH820) TaxID=405535 RepID=B7JNX3_BACC0|nr:hypothetical protein [Bacillus cereus]ACK87477.1 hypothetical protein BCAH820_4363 [Bacillus cereus AH820]